MARKAPRKTRTRRRTAPTAAAATHQEEPEEARLDLGRRPGRSQRDAGAGAHPGARAHAQRAAAADENRRRGSSREGLPARHAGIPLLRLRNVAPARLRLLGRHQPGAVVGNRQGPAGRPGRRGGFERLLHARRVRRCARPAFLPRGRRHADVLLRREPRRRLPRDGPRDPRRAAARAVRRADDRSRGLPRVVRGHERHPDGAAGRLVPPARADRHAGRAEPQLAPVAARRAAGRGDSRGAP